MQQSAFSHLLLGMGAERRKIQGLSCQSTSHLLWTSQSDDHLRHTLCLTMRCWKSQERMMLVACFGRTPLLFLDFLSSLSNRDDRSKLTLTINTGGEEKKREWMICLTYCCHGNKGRLPIIYFFQWQGHKHLLKSHHGNWIWVITLKAAPFAVLKHKRVICPFGASIRSVEARLWCKVYISPFGVELVTYWYKVWLFLSLFFICIELSLSWCSVRNPYSGLLFGVKVLKDVKLLEYWQCLTACHAFMDVCETICLGLAEPYLWGPTS